MAVTSSAQWSFRHKIVDKQYYSASLGIAVFSHFCSYCCLIMPRYLWKKRNLLNETEIVLWQESDWKVRFPECESDNSK